MDVDTLIENELYTRGDLTPEGMATLCQRHPKQRAALLDFYAAWWLLGLSAGAGAGRRRSADHDG